MMSSATTTTNRKDGQGISTTRRHVYFYLLLFLGTAAMHTVWKGPEASDVQPESQQAQELMAKAEQLTEQVR